MGCCGKNRSDLMAQYGHQYPGNDAQNLPAAPASVTFQYNGQSAVTVAGSITGRRYRFAGYGAQAVVDSRDAPGMRGVPHLQRVM